MTFDAVLQTLVDGCAGRGAALMASVLSQKFGVLFDSNAQAPRAGIEGAPAGR